MQWLEQAHDARNCGQIAVAVVTDTPLETVTRMIGHSRPTNTQTLVRVIRELGFGCRDDCRSRKRPEVGLAQLHDTIGPLRLRDGEFFRAPPRSGWHWVVVHGNRVFDGLWGGPTGVALWPEGYKMTSFLPVER